MSKSWLIFLYDVINFQTEGTEIYSVEGNTEVVLAKDENGNYEVFELFSFN